ncbi:MAG TPA: hypothetical protein VHB79_37190 [Polyangiaceae bacterium]|nr:hypothetical protein [Polyangiaceae bacterium]
MTRYIRVRSLLGVLFILGGCASSRAAQNAAPASASSTPAAPPHQMMMPGTTVAVADADGGVALTFTTTQSSEVDELRGRVKRMAALHNQGGMMSGGMMSGGMMGGGMMGGGMMSGEHGMRGEGPMPAAEASTEDVDGGVRLIFKPKDAAQLEALRGHLKKQAEHMQRGTCPMMSAHADAAPNDAK